MSSGSPEPLALVVRQVKNSDEAEIDVMVDALMAAFDSDKFTDVLAGHDRSLWPLLFRSLVAAGLIGGTVFVAGLGPDDVSGVAVWFGPGQECFNTEEQRAAGYTDLMASFPPGHRKWWDDCFASSVEACAATALAPGHKKDTWYLQLFGVHPKRQRQGVARALINAVKELAAPSRAILTLETPTDVNVAIYDRLGFGVRGQTLVTSPWGDHLLRFMVHENKSASG